MFLEYVISLTPFSLAYTNNALVVPMNAALAVSDISI
jgi:hypothetical protein